MHTHSNWKRTSGNKWQLCAGMMVVIAGRTHLPIFVYVVADVWHVVQWTTKTLSPKERVDEDCLYVHELN